MVRVAAGSHCQLAGPRTPAGSQLRGKVGRFSPAKALDPAPPAAGGRHRRVRRRLTAGWVQVDEPSGGGSVRTQGVTVTRKRANWLAMDACIMDRVTVWWRVLTFTWRAKSCMSATDANAGSSACSARDDSWRYPETESDLVVGCASFPKTANHIQTPVCATMSNRPSGYFPTTKIEIRGI